MWEKERVVEVEDRSRKDTKTEKNGETPRERGVNCGEKDKGIRKRKEMREKNTQSSGIERLTKGRHT